MQDWQINYNDFEKNTSEVYNLVFSPILKDKTRNLKNLRQQMKQ